MAHRVGRVVEVEDLATFDALVAGGSRRMRGWRLQGVDLTERTAVLLTLDPAESLVLGCPMSDEAAAHLRGRGAVVFPAIPDVPVDAYRTRTYDGGELYAGIGRAEEAQRTNPYEETPDARIYAWSQQPGKDPAHEVARALHDRAMEAALDDAIGERRLVGVMGGHAVERGSDAYAGAARLGRGLARAGFAVGTGGGPGAMEAANLGSFLAAVADDALAEACRMLATTPSFRPSVAGWVARAFAVRERWPGGDGGIGIPTWFYGHEPPNVFPGAIAKFFQNSVREATLLQRCDGGIVFLPGAAGTVQEVFQDACENYYAEAATAAPMVLVGVEHWTRRLPVWPLLSALAEGRPMAARLALVDTVDAAVAALGHEQMTIR